MKSSSSHFLSVGFHKDVQLNFYSPIAQLWQEACTVNSQECKWRMVGHLTICYLVQLITNDQQTNMKVGNEYSIKLTSCTLPKNTNN
jgi:hypothetical protein